MEEEIEHKEIRVPIVPFEEDAGIAEIKPENVLHNLEEQLKPAFGL